jgi:EmrB/QacA subfamily drug resistance transporter
VSHPPALQHQPAPVNSLPDPRRWRALVLLCLAQFMVILDVTVVNVALPDIGRDLALTSSALTWAVTAYTLTFGGLLILGGRLADAYGRRRTFLVGLALFTAASLGAGLSGSGGMLLAARVAQGIGAALLSPAALSILTTMFTGRDRNRALGAWAAIGGGGAAVGVLVGGALTSGPGWEWAFFINVPVGLLVAVAVPATIAATAGQGRRVDLLGALTGTAAVGLLIYGLIRTGETGWTSASALLPIAGAIVAAIAFVGVERSVTQPLVPLAFLRRPPLPAATLVMLAASGLLVSAFFLNSLYLQSLLRLSALRTGLAFLPVALATMIGAHLATRAVARFGARPVAAAGFAATAAGLALLSRLPEIGHVASDVLPGFLLAAAGLGAGFVAATTTAMSRVDHHHAGLASGIINTGHELGASLGIAVVSAIAGPSLAGAATAPATGFGHAFATTAAVAALLAVVTPLLLPAGRPAGDAPIFAH